MVALKTNELQSILKSGAEKIDAFLVHGTDAGQVAEVARMIADRLKDASKPPGEIIRLSEQDLGATPGRLASEARSLAMFGGRPIIAVKQGPQLQPAMLQELLDGSPLAAHIVVEAGNLKRDAKIRQIFEKAKNAAAIACYGADNRSLAQLIREEVQNAGLTISGEAEARLAQLLGADWAVSRAEIVKLTLYTLGEKEITLDHVEAIVGDASAHAFDAAISDTMSGNAASALLHLEGLIKSGTPAQVFLTLFTGHLQKLHFILAAIDGGSSFDVAVSRLRPPLHFRQKDAIKAQTARWRLVEVAAAIALANEVLRQTRLKPALEDALVSDFILRLCRGAKRSAA
ncbi:MAG: DNA polymerase III subunit delta [Rhodomicrobiaceae bacterium]